MLHSLKRSLQCRQVGHVLVSCSVNGTAGTPAASGTDAMFIESVTDNGTGDYTITIKEKSKQDLEVIGLVSLTEAAILHVEAVTESTINVKAVDDAGVAVDADFTVAFRFADQLSYNF